MTDHTDPTLNSKLTVEQEAAVNARTSSVALSSGAGCGKTTVLTERYLTTLDSKLANGAASAIAVTFTEKSARELRERIRAACHDKLERATDADRAHWRGVLRALEAAPIGTFHQYCAGLLRRHALRAGIDPDFEVLDATIASTLRADATSHSMRRWLAESNADFIELAVEYGTARVCDGLGVLIDSRGETSLEEWVGLSDDEVIARWTDVWDARCRPIMNQTLVNEANTCRQVFATEAFENNKLKQLGAQLLVELRALRDHLDQPEWVNDLHETAKVPLGLRQKDWPSPEIKERVGKSLENFRKAIRVWATANLFDRDASIKAARHARLFARLALEARREFEQAKRTRGGLDFDDLLLMTVDLLRTDAARIRRRVRGDQVAPILLVDEFQDTDPVQNEILRLLGGEEIDSGRLFVVGDFKQSIYGFRGARPEIFTELRERLPKAGQLDLSENFRSVPAVLDFVNALFADAFSEKYVPLRTGPNASAPSGGGTIEFVWAEEPSVARDAALKEEKVDVEQRRRVEAGWLARLIRERIDAGWPVRSRDKSSMQVRDADPGDIAFLFRSMTVSHYYEAALAAEGLDFHVVGGASFYARQEIQDVVNVLSVLEDPRTVTRSHWPAHCAGRSLA